MPPCRRFIPRRLNNFASDVERVGSDRTDEAGNVVRDFSFLTVQISQNLWTKTDTGKPTTASLVVDKAGILAAGGGAIHIHESVPHQPKKARGTPSRRHAADVL